MTPGHEGYDMEKILFRSHYLTQTSIWARDDASFVVHIEIIESIDQEIVNSTVQGVGNRTHRKDNCTIAV